jgi:hypothetical protein
MPALPSSTLAALVVVVWLALGAWRTRARDA